MVLHARRGTHGAKGSRSWASSALIFLAFSALASPARSATFFWVGTDGDYHDADNWNDGVGSGLPGASDDVVVDTSGVPDIFITSDVTHQKLTATQVNFNLSATYTLSFADLYQATFTGGDYVAGTTRIDGVGASSFTNVNADFGNTFVIGTLNLDGVLGTTDSITLIEQAGSPATLNLNQTSLTTTSADLLRGSAIIGAGSSFTAENGINDIYTSSLILSESTVDVLGSLTTWGSLLGFYQGDITASSTVNVYAGGSWTDTSVATKSIGFGAVGALNVDGGQITFGDGELRIGEGSVDFDSNPINGEGTVTVSSQGQLSAEHVIVGGVTRYVGGGSSKGTLLVNGTGSYAEIGSLRATDDNDSGSAEASVFVQSGGELKIGSMLMGAINLDPQTRSSSSFISTFDSKLSIDYAEMIGSPIFGGAPQLVSQNSELALGSLRLFNNAFATVTNSDVRLGGLTVGTQGSTSASATFTGGTMLFDRTIISQPIDIRAGQGTITFKNASLNSNGIIRLWTFERDGGRIVFDNASYQGEGLAGIDANGTLEVKDSQLQFFNTIDVNNILISPALFDIGVASAGTVDATNAQIEAWRVRLGMNSNGDATVVLRDSQLAGTSTTYTAVNLASVIVGLNGQAEVVMFNGEISGPRIYIGPQGLVKGDGLLNGDSLTSTGFTDVINDGTISPGHSPGRIDIAGNLENRGVLELEIDLANPTSYDQLFGSGSFKLGGTLRLKALNTGAFDPTKSYTLLSAGSITGMFSSFEIDPAFGITSSAFSLNGGNFGINPVPEPATVIALGVGLAALLRRRRSA